MYIDKRTAAKLRGFIRRVNVLSSMINETDDILFKDLFLRLKWHDGDEAQMEKAAERMNTFMGIIRDYAAENKDEYMEIIRGLPQEQRFEVIRGGQAHGEI